MIKRIKDHIFTIPQKIELLIIYGILMFVLGISSNYFISKNEEISDGYDSDDYYQVATNFQKENQADKSNSNLNGADDLAKIEPSAGESKKNRESAERNKGIKGTASRELIQNKVLLGGKKNDTEEAKQKILKQLIIVKAGENFTKLMQKLGLDRKEIYNLGSKIDNVFPLRNLKPGQKIQVSFIEKDNNLVFKELIINFPLFVVSASKEGVEGKIKAILVKKKLKKNIIYRSGTIKENLYSFAKKNNVPIPIIPPLIDVFSFDVDFQRDIVRGTPIEVLYEKLTDDDGKFVSFGKILYASIRINGEMLKIYHFKYSEDLDYFKPDGSSIKRALLKTPIDGAIISSHFGNRKHPILGYTKKHKGIDFAAKTGTPLFAAGDGIITKIGRNGGYGNYIRIRHNNKYDTAYAHLSKFAKGLKRGRKVKQGQIIAYVGSTGASTGPHLHFEILKNNIQVNPLKVKSHKEKKIRGKIFADFTQKVDEINKILTKLSQGS